MSTKLILLFLIIGLVFTSCNDKKADVSYSKKEQPKALKELSPLEKSIKTGKVIYKDMCVVCHLDNGKGVPKAFPPLANSDYLKDNQEESILGLKKGMKGEIVVNGETYNSYMAPLGLGNDEIADVMNYINNSWGNDFGKMISEEEVANLIKK
ncbi:cytochrome c [uncultured Winogradskyella sp.]|uniref:c-type cytochrome n=1 Tax=uncultured Winogradskyella sp. TaxID=395353 RepID=UPI00260B0870|nr:cytochrome c [uncultured Winogradskyella sp.]